MFHIVAINISEEFYLKLISQSTKSIVAKDFDIEEESDSQNNSGELDDFDAIDDDYLVTSFSLPLLENDKTLIEISRKIPFFFCVNSLPQGNYEIQIPPPRA